MDATDTYTGDMVEANSSAPSISLSPTTAVRSPAFGITAQRSKMEMPEINLQNAYKTIQFYQQEPQWLANPRTRYAAGAHFSQATRIIDINRQIERASNVSLAAREEQSMVARQVKMASEIVSANPTAKLSDGRPVSSMWVKNQDGMAAIMDISNLGEISALHGQHVKPPLADSSGDLVGIEIQMPDGSTVQAIRNTQGKGYTVVPRKGDAETAIAEKETSKKISRLETDARELEKKYMSANAEYVEAMSGNKIEGKSQKAIKDKADYFRARQMDKMGQVEALRNPSGSTNAPATSAPETELKVGDEYKGYKWLGGDKSDKNNWQKVSP